LVVEGGGGDGPGLCRRGMEGKRGELGLLGYLAVIYGALVVLLLSWVVYLQWRRRERIWKGLKRSFRYWVLGEN